MCHVLWLAYIPGRRLGRGRLTPDFLLGRPAALQVGRAEVGEDLGRAAQRGGRQDQLVRLAVRTVEADDTDVLALVEEGPGMRKECCIGAATVLAAPIAPFAFWRDRPVQSEVVFTDVQSEPQYGSLGPPALHVARQCCVVGLELAELSFKQLEVLVAPFAERSEAICQRWAMMWYWPLLTSVPGEPVHAAFPSVLRICVSLQSSIQKE